MFLNTLAVGQHLLQPNQLFNKQSSALICFKSLSQYSAWPLAQAEDLHSGFRPVSVLTFYFMAETNL